MGFLMMRHTTALGIALAVMTVMAGGPTLADPQFELLRSYYATDKMPLDVVVSRTAQANGVMRTDLNFLAFDNERITGRLEVPLGVENPPVVILLHGITQSLDQWWRQDDGPYSFPSKHRIALIKAGFAVFAIDVRNHGARKSMTDFDDPYTYLELAYYEAGKKMISQSVLDVRRAIDVIETLAGINSDRIGLEGFSLGASIGYLATAVDPRIDASVIMAMPFLPVAEGQTASYTSPFGYVAGLKGRAVAYIAATDDPFYPMDAVKALVASIPTDVQLIWVDGGHDLPAETAEMALKFLQKNL